MEKFGKKYVSSQKLKEYIDWLQRQSIYVIAFGVAVFMLFLLLFYIRDGWSLKFAIEAVLIVALWLTMIYAGTFRRAKIVSNTISSVLVDGHKLIIETFPYNLGILSKALKCIEINIEELSVKEMDYPIIDKRYISNKVVGICIKEDELFLIKEYFEAELLDHFES